MVDHSDVSSTNPPTPRPPAGTWHRIAPVAFALALMAYPGSPLTGRGPAGATTGVVEDTGGGQVTSGHRALFIGAISVVGRELSTQYRIELPAPAARSPEVSVPVAFGDMGAGAPVPLAPTATLTRPAEQVITGVAPSPEGDQRGWTRLLVLGLVVIGALVVVGAVSLARRRRTRRRVAPWRPLMTPAAIIPVPARRLPRAPAPPLSTARSGSEPGTASNPATTPSPADDPPHADGLPPLLPDQETSTDVRTRDEDLPADETLVIAVRTPRPTNRTPLPVPPGPRGASDPPGTPGLPTTSGASGGSSRQARSGLLDADLRAAATQADRALLDLRARMRSFDGRLPLEGFVLREAVASINLDGGDVALWDMFRSRSGNAPGVTDLAPDVERMAEALRAAATDTAQGQLGHGVLSGLVERRGVGNGHRPGGGSRSRPTTSPNGHGHRPTPDIAGPASGPALRAAWAREVVESGWPDPAERRWLGRAALWLSLARDGLLTEPVLDVSGAPSEVAAHTSADELVGSLRDTIEILLTSSTATRHHLDDLSDLRASYLDEVNRGRPSRAPAAVDTLLANPVITAQFLADAIDLSHQGALNLIRRFEQRGWLERIESSGRGGRKYWIAPEVLAIFETDLPAVQTYTSPRLQEMT